MAEENVKSQIAEILKSMTPEEANKPVVWAELIGAMTAWEDKRMTLENELSQAKEKSLNKIFDALIEQIRKERYERVRYERFMTTLLCSVFNLDKDTIDAEYLRYKKAFDEINLKEEVNGR